jgi:hypothetical protein
MGYFAWNGRRTFIDELKEMTKKMVAACREVATAALSWRY